MPQQCVPHPFPTRSPTPVATLKARPSGSLSLKSIANRPSPESKSSSRSVKTPKLPLGFTPLLECFTGIPPRGGFPSSQQTPKILEALPLPPKRLPRECRDCEIFAEAQSSCPGQTARGSFKAENKTKSPFLDLSLLEQKL